MKNFTLLKNMPYSIIEIHTGNTGRPAKRKTLSQLPHQMDHPFKLQFELPWVFIIHEVLNVPTDH